MRPRSASALFVLCLFLGAAGLPAQGDLVAEGDAAWARRAEGHQGGRAAAGPVNQAIAAYERAVEARPARLEACWKLLRALHFKGEHVARTREEKQAVFGRGREVVEKALDLLGQRVGGRGRLDGMTPQQTARALAAVPEAAPVFLYGAIHWGLWGDAFGRVAAARQGVGDRIRHYGEVAVAIDERYETAGGHRLLGRLHTLAPRIPLVTGWVDRARAVSELRRALELAPGDPYNQLFLAEALLEHQPGRADEARAILRKLVARRPSAERPVEEAKAIADARALLAKHPG
jgi:tetratricopeptide (TPR) repeat protein